MRRWVVTLIGTSIGIGSFFILPGAFKFLGFFFSIVCFSIALRADNQRFNFHIILISMIIFLLFGSSMVTFDASQPIITGAMIETVSIGLNTLTILMAFGIPIVLILGAIFAFILGKADASVKALFYALIVMVVVLAFAYISDIAGFDTFGTSDWILDFYEELISYMFELPINLYEGVDKALELASIGTINLPDIPENEFFRQPTPFNFEEDLTLIDGVSDGMLDQLSEDLGGLPGDMGATTDLFSSAPAQQVQSDLPFFSALSYQEVVYAIHDSLPLIAGLFNLIALPFFANRHSEEIIVAFINKFQFKSKKEMPRKRQIGKRTTKIDPVMVCFLFAIAFIALFIFLGYTNAYGENSKEDWRYTIFIYYIFLTVMSGFSLMYIFRTYTPVTIWSFIKGNFYGIAGLMLISRIFMSRATYNAFSTIQMHSNGWYAINTFIFIAPTETICFLVALPCLFLWIMMRSERKQTKEDKFFTIQQQINRADMLILAQDIRISQKQKELKNTKDRKIFYGSLEGALYHRKATKTSTHLKPLDMKKFEAKETDKLKRLRKEVQKLIEGLGKLKYAKSQLIKKQQTIYIPLQTVQRNKMLTQPKKAFAFGIAILISAFVFSSLHWPIISPEIDYGHYWLMGMGVINFSAGCYMAIIAWKYDWLSATTAHAWFNCSTILLVIFSAGV